MDIFFFSSLIRYNHMCWFELVSQVSDVAYEGPLVNGHFRGPGCDIYVCLAVELSIPVLKTYVCPKRWSNPGPPHARWTLYHRATAAVALCIKNLILVVPLPNFALVIPPRSRHILVSPWVLMSTAMAQWVWALASHAVSEVFKSQPRQT